MRKNVFILKEKQEFIDQAFKSALPSTSTGVTSSGKLDPFSLYSFPQPIPHEEINDDYPSDQDGDVPVDSVEYPQSLVHLIPNAYDDLQLGSVEGGQADPDQIRYFIRESGTRNGNTCIEDSHGYTYSYQCKNKAGYFTYWFCIKRQWKGTDNCLCSIRIENIEKGADEMTVVRMGSQGHNHDQDFSNIIRKDLNEELKKQAMNYPLRSTNEIIEKVLSENADFQTYFENKSAEIGSGGKHTGLPDKKSMARTVQRARDGIKAPNVSDPEFVFEEQWIKSLFFSGRSNC